MQNDSRNNNNNQGGVSDFSGYSQPNNTGRNPSRPNNSNNPNSRSNPANSDNSNNSGTPNGRIVYDEYGNAYLVDSHGNAVRVNIQNPDENISNNINSNEQPRPQIRREQLQRPQQGQSQRQPQSGQQPQQRQPQGQPSQQSQSSRGRTGTQRQTRDSRGNNNRRKSHSNNNNNNRQNRSGNSRSERENQNQNRRRFPEDYDERQNVQNRPNEYNQTGERPQEDCRRYSSQPEKPRRRRRKHHIFGKIIMAVLAVAVLSQALMLRYVSKINQVEPKQRYDVTADITSDKVENILLIGSDTRDAEAAGRTDSMMLFSFNRQTRTMTTTSFMRDMYVEIPNHGWDKLNAAYAYGGAELLMDTLTLNFGIEINGYLYIDFYSFIDIVDAVGGIDVEISDEEAQGMIAPMAEQNKILGNKKGTDYLTKGGNLHLNGNQALAYSRLRYVGNADFERTQRQRLVVSKILEKSKKLNPFALDKFLATACKNLSSDMSTLELMGTADRGILYLTYKQENLRIPAEGTYYFDKANGQSILSVDFDANKQLIKESIYNQ